MLYYRHQHPPTRITASSLLIPFLPSGGGGGKMAVKGQPSPEKPCAGVTVWVMDAAGRVGMS